MPDKKRLLILTMGLGIGVILVGLILFNNRYLLLQYALKKLDRIDIAWMGLTRQKVVALTFDDGPDSRYTPRILAILKKYHTPATFFVTGANALKYPKLVLDEYRSGFMIGNHSFSHPHLAMLTTTKVITELMTTDRAIQEATGMNPSLFRPPYEELSGDIIPVSRRLHKKIVLSTITLEHKSAKNPRAMAERVVKLVFPGAIILMHDGRLNRDRTVKALPYLIKALSVKGYRIVPVQRLLSTNS